MAAIEIENLQKRFRNVEALRGISLTIPEGEFFGLLGPNGAGKTTLIKSIVGLVHPTTGSIRVCGRDSRKDPLFSKSCIGLSPQEPNIDRYFSVSRTLEFQGGFYGIPRTERKNRAQELMDQFGLSDKAEDEYWKLSGGMQKRVLIARSLMMRPRILILDEPTAGVDVEQRNELWATLRNLNKDGTTILLTTHYIDEAEELCERVAIIAAGQVVEMGSPKSLVGQHDKKKLEEVFLKVIGRRHEIPDTVFNAH